jgi:hypothetical protein
MVRENVARALRLFKNLEKLVIWERYSGDRDRKLFLLSQEAALLSKLLGTGSGDSDPAYKTPLIEIVLDESENYID